MSKPARRYTPEETEQLEMHGLKIIVDNAVKSRTIHTIAPRPERHRYQAKADYLDALAHWQHNQAWTITNLP